MLPTFIGAPWWKKWTESALMREKRLAGRSVESRYRIRSRPAGECRLVDRVDRGEPPSQRVLYQIEVGDQWLASVTARRA